MIKDKNINGYPFELYKKEAYDAPESIKRSADYLRFMDKRRTIRNFAARDVPREIIENIMLTASTAPSGVHKQPWTFCAISNPKLKRDIREAAEQEEQENYNSRFSKELLVNLRQLQTDATKVYLETAPWLIAVFKQTTNIDKAGYYTEESMGIAAGMLLSAIHNAGLAALTQGPEPLSFLKDKLGRPANEEPYLLISVGYPAEDCYVPKLIRKGLKDIAVFYEE
jgi:iodotyrosine deiodinase